MKQCIKCAIIKPIDSFYKKSGKPHLTTPSCKECFKKDSKERRIKNPDIKRKSHMKNMYGMSLEQYNELKEAQNNCCAICDKPASAVHYKRLYIDHCHITGKIRELLCSHCNLALGQAEDNIPRLKKMIEYLEKHGTNI